MLHTHHTVLRFACVSQKNNPPIIRVAIKRDDGKPLGMTQKKKQNYYRRTGRKCAVRNLIINGEAFSALEISF